MRNFLMHFKYEIHTKTQENMLNKIEKICMAHQYLIKMNTAKTALKWDENLKSSIFFYPPFYVKNSNNYIITLCMFLKGISWNQT
jgi:hypothetical protein